MQSECKRLKIQPPKILPAQDQVYPMKKLESRCPATIFCTNGQAIRQPHLIYTVLYLLCDIRFYCILTMYKITLNGICDLYSW